MSKIKVELKLEEWASINVAISGYSALLDSVKDKSMVVTEEILVGGLSDLGKKLLPVHLDESFRVIKKAMDEDEKSLHEGAKHGLQ